jgi:hypothetical protein
MRWLDMLTLSWRNLGVLFAFLLVFGVVHILATELIPARRSRGEVLLFKRRAGIRQKARHRADEESGVSTNFSQDTILGDGEKPGDQTKDKVRIKATQVQSSVFHWSGLGYEIKTKDNTRRILNNIDGWVKPGTLTALMVCFPLRP